jgi:hypothetical protein
MPMAPERLDDMERLAAAGAAINEGGWTDLAVLDLIAEVRRLAAERDEANERIRDLEKSVARLVERANRQRDRIGRAHDLLSGVDADV